MPPERVSRATLGLTLAALLVVLAAGVILLVAVAPTGDPLPANTERGPGDASRAYIAGQGVDVWHAGKWYPGHVHGVGTGRYFITYDGYSVSWNEWVDATRLRPRAGKN